MSLREVVEIATRNADHHPEPEARDTYRWIADRASRKLAAVALILAALVAVPAFARQASIAPAPAPAVEVSCQRITIEGTVVSAVREQVDDFAAGTMTDYLRVRVLRADGSLVRVLVPYSVLERPGEDAMPPSLGWSIRATSAVMVVPGHETPQYVAQGFATSP